MKNKKITKEDELIDKFINFLNEKKNEDRIIAGFECESDGAGIGKIVHKDGTIIQVRVVLEHKKQNFVDEYQR